MMKQLDYWFVRELKYASMIEEYIMRFIEISLIVTGIAALLFFVYVLFYNH